MQDGMHTRNINCCRTLFFTTSKLLFIPLWQSWDCLLGSLCCQVCSGQTASSCCTFKIHRNLMHRPCSPQWLNLAGDWSQPMSAQRRTHLGAGFSLWSSSSERQGRQNCIVWGLSSSTLFFPSASSEMLTYISFWGAIALFLLLPFLSFICISAYKALVNPS